MQNKKAQGKAAELSVVELEELAAKNEDMKVLRALQSPKTASSSLNTNITQQQAPTKATPIVIDDDDASELEFKRMKQCELDLQFELRVLQKQYLKKYNELSQISTYKNIATSVHPYNPEINLQQLEPPKISGPEFFSNLATNNAATKEPVQTSVLNVLRPSETQTNSSAQCNSTTQIVDEEEEEKQFLQQMALALLQDNSE